MTKSEKLEALRDAVILVADLCDCGTVSCRFKSGTGPRRRDKCLMDPLSLEQSNRIDALSRLFHAARELLDEASP